MGVSDGHNTVLTEVTEPWRETANSTRTEPLQTPTGTDYLVFLLWYFMRDYDVKINMDKMKCREWQITQNEYDFLFNTPIRGCQPCYQHEDICGCRGS